MERTRKRLKGKSLRASNKLKKSKPRDGSCSSATLEDQSTKFREDDNPIEEKAKTDLLTKRRGRPKKAGLKKSVKEEKVGHEESKITKRAPNRLSKLYTCACGKRYTSAFALRRHQKTNVGCDVDSGQHFVGSEKPFQCMCGKTFSISSTLNRHLKTCQVGYSTHSNARENLYKPYVCACGKRYTGSSQLYRHQRIHSHKSKKRAEKNYICDCGKKFTVRAHLLRHQETHTLEIVQIQLEGDPEEVNEMESPGRIKPYVCQCGKSYTCSSHLYRHQRTHHNKDFSSSSRYWTTGMEKPYKCECGRSYTSSSHLYRHQKTHEMMEFIVDDPDCDSDVHNEDFEEKPYQCECGKSFILWFSLMVHKRIHCKANLQTSSGQEDSP
ncbi:zinc finger protein 883-like [Bufo gargarizans]|uniref:zinc finger protein 883-like n=1 Tax=Bufo gargarizans TaxID=30331 RepID=UPI001CF34E69|nr:zinc finger protein 883-like [Bufo gargarizans]XP_044162479.1 zinc finger protein 883-like [Bufo gargarizans]